MEVFKEAGNVQIACFVGLFIVIRIVLRMYLTPTVEKKKKNLFAPDPKYWKKGDEPDENVIKIGYVSHNSMKTSSSSSSIQSLTLPQFTYSLKMTILSNNDNFLEHSRTKTRSLVYVTHITQNQSTTIHSFIHSFTPLTHITHCHSK